METVLATAVRARVEFVARRFHSPRYSSREPVEIVSGKWLVKSIIACLVAAGFALYCAVCLLFYQGQWQFVFSRNPASHPNVAAIASSSGLPIQNVQFDYTEEGIAQLDGWWIPAEDESKLPASAQGSKVQPVVVLFCPNGRTTLPENIDALRAFHSLGVSVFAFDYRGTGLSSPGHPSQEKAYADGVSAFRYLTGMRHIVPNRIVLYGAEMGSAVAGSIAAQWPAIAGLVLENPQPSLTKQVRREQHIHLLPMWLIFRKNFDISQIIPALKMPKLIVATSAKPEYLQGAEYVYNEAAPPKQKININENRMQALYTEPAWSRAIQQFLNQLDRDAIENNPSFTNKIDR